MTYREVIDRIEELQTCYEAVGELINPDVESFDRGKVCQLHAVLEREMAKALAELHNIMKNAKIVKSVP